jgi:cysteine desulfurase
LVRTVRPIYLDYNSTTPIDPAVLKAMLPWLKEGFGNPSCTHLYGREAHTAVERAREQVADLLGASGDEIVFTGGGSEASNHAIQGSILQSETDLGRNAHVIISAVEHPATMQPCVFLRGLGCEVTVLPVDRFGMVDPDDVRRAITPRTRLVSIMHSNNEVGTFNPIREIAAVARERGVRVHTDVAQSLGKVAVDVNDLGVDLLSVAGHKLYAPKGVGALYIRRGVELTNLIHGAGHERGRRAGTENVPYLVGLGKAAEWAAHSLPVATDRLRTLRDRLHAYLTGAMGDQIVLNGHPEQRLPNTLNLNFVGHIGEDLLTEVPDVAASTGSACHAGLVTVSPVLRAMGVPEKLARGAVRLSVGRFTTEIEIDQAAKQLIAAAS